MSTFLVRVEAIVGTTSETTDMSDWLTAGARNFIDLLPEEKALRITTTANDPGTGVAVASMRVFGAYKAGYRAIPLHPEEYARYVDSASRFYGTSTTPVYYILNGTLFVKPGGGTARVIAYPTVAYTDSAITGLPAEWEQIVVLYAAIQYLHNKAIVAITTLGGLTIATVVIPTAPTTPSFTYTDALLGTYTSTVVGDLGTVPSYTKPTTLVNFTTYDTYLHDSKDIELSAEERGKMAVWLNQYQTDIQNEQNEFNKELQIYQSTVQKAFNDAQLAQQRILQTASDTKDINLQNEGQTLAQQIQEYQAKLGKYQSEIQAYGAEVNTNISIFSAKVQRDMGEVSSRLNLIQSLRSELQNHFATLGIKQ